MDISYKEVWTTLSQVDCSKYVDTKMNLTYLSWAHAYGLLMKSFPQAEYVFDNDDYNNDGSVMVNTTINIGDLKRSMFLPVMDHKNNSIMKPTSRQISDARMRCLVKNIAVFGLGHYIYAGEDLPNKEIDQSEKKVQEKANKSEYHEYKLITSDGEELGVFIGEDALVKELRTQIGVENPQQNHRDFFKTNFDTILLASKKAQGQSHTALAKLLGMYWENKANG